MQLTQETVSILTPALLGLIIAIMTAAAAWAHSWVAWSRMQSAKWEAMSQQIIDEAKKSLKVSEDNRELLRKAAATTELIAKNNDGMNDKLKEIAVRSAASRIREAIAEKRTLEPDDLDRIEEEVMDSLMGKP